MGVLLTHPTGNQNVRAILGALQSEQMLSAFGTTVALDEKSKLLNLLPGRMKIEALRRSYEGIPTNKIFTYPLRELSRSILPQIGFKSLTVGEKSWAGIYNVYQRFDKKMASLLSSGSIQNIDAVYAYEDGALNTFKIAKELGIKCVYDLPIAYWETLRALMIEEAERMPAWKKTLGSGITDSNEKLERKTAELELADVVVGPGNFVLNSIPLWASAKQTIMAPFGSPRQTFKGIGTPNDPANPLKILFVGSMGQRKGLGDLFEAMKFLDPKRVELVVMGGLMEDLAFYKQQYPEFKYEAVRPHHKVLELMRSCDVFCLPSIVEGRALVMQEAMSQGLPIIITPNTGGEDLVIEGKTGFLVPIQSPRAIADCIQWFLDNRNKIDEMGNNAREYAMNYTWENYAGTVVENLKSFVNL